MRKAETKNLAGYCGFYCGVCEIYRAYRDSQELREIIAEKHGCSPGEVRCAGCRAVEEIGWKYDKEWSLNCKIRKCAIEKGVEFCIDCEDFEKCTKFKKFAEICKGLGIEVIRNMKEIKEKGIEKWLTEQDKKYRCKYCGKPIIVSYEFKKCHRCGKNDERD